MSKIINKICLNEDTGALPYISNKDLTYSAIIMVLKQTFVFLTECPENLMALCQIYNEEQIQ